MDENEIFASLREAVIQGDANTAEQSSRQAVEANVDPLVAVEMGLAKGMKVVGEQFECDEIYLPELMMAADAFRAAMAVLNPEIKKQTVQLPNPGTVLLATVRGDLHSIGKNIVATVLEANGYRVVDLGIDRAALEIIEEAEKVQADVIGLSALMSTTLPYQKEVIDALQELNLRHKYRVIVGGGPTTQEWADEIGADGYGRDPVAAVGLLQRLLSA